MAYGYVVLCNWCLHKMFLKNIRKMMMGDNEKNLEKEKLNVQNDKLLNNGTHEKQDYQCGKLNNVVLEKLEPQSCKLQEQQKARKLSKIKIIVTIAVVAMALLVLVSIIVDITKKCTATDNNTTKCGAPPNVNHGWYSTIGNIPGSVSVLNCTEGYIGIGDKEIFCQNDGQWSKSTFVCMKDCQSPPNVMNSTNMISGLQASYRCNDGFYPVGDTTIECQDGNWSTIKFSCSKYCGSPPDIPFSAYKMNGNISGAKTAYNCLNGYVPVGEPNIVCNSNGEWSPVKLSCLKDCPKPPDVMSSTSWKSANKSGVYTTYRCDPGFYIVGQPSIVCQDGVWSTVKFSCSKYCGLPPDTPFSTNQISGNVSGAITSYRCLDGYVPVGESNIVCNNNGEWSPVKLSCFKDCSEPPDVLNSAGWKSANKSGVYATYRCDLGFYLVGQPSIVCEDGVWSAVKFSCFKYCGSPPIVPYSTSRIEGNKSGAKTSFQCSSGYIPVGDRNIFCESNGKWSTPDLSCLIDCGFPPSKYLAEAYYETTYSGSKAIYSCKSGFTHFGNPTATCISNGNWFMNNFYCKQPETSSANVIIPNIRIWTFTLVFGIMVKVVLLSI